MVPVPTHFDYSSIVHHCDYMLYGSDIVLSISPEDFPQETRPAKPYEPEKVVTVTDIVGDNKVPHNKANNSVMPSHEPIQNHTGSISSQPGSPRDTPVPPAPTEGTLAVPKQFTSQDDSSGDDTTCSKVSETGDQDLSKGKGKGAKSHAWSVFRAHNRKKFCMLQRRMTDCHLNSFTTPLDKDEEEEEGVKQDENFL